MKLLVVVLFLSFCFQSLEVTIAKSYAPLSRIDNSESGWRRSLQAQTNDTATTEAPIPTLTVNGTEIPSNSSIPSDTTISASPTSAPSSALTATLAPTLTSDETKAPEESSSGIKATDIALIVVGLIGVGFLGFGVAGSFFSGSKNAVNENVGAAFPAPSSAAPGVEIAEA